MLSLAQLAITALRYVDGIFFHGRSTSLPAPEVRESIMRDPLFLSPLVLGIESLYLIFYGARLDGLT
jgi:hypothetical protein